MTRADLMDRYMAMSRVLTDHKVSDAKAVAAIDAFGKMPVPAELEDMKTECILAASRTMECRCMQHGVGPPV